MNSIIKQMQQLTIAMKKLEMNEMNEMNKHDIDSNVNKNELVFYDLDPIECDICMNEYQDDGYTCDQCKKNICIKCYSNVNKCPFCRKKYDKEEPTVNNTPLILNDWNMEYVGFPMSWVVNNELRLLRWRYILNSNAIGRQEQLTLNGNPIEPLSNITSRAHLLYRRHLNRLERAEATRRQQVREQQEQQKINEGIMCKHCRREFKNKGACTNHTRHHCNMRPNQ